MSRVASESLEEFQEILHKCERVSEVVIESLRVVSSLIQVQKRSIEFLTSSKNLK